MKIISKFLKTSCILLGIGVMVSGCGFKPMYGKTANLDVNDELQKIYVPVLSNRYGQLVRQALQQNLAGAGPEDPKTYQLDVSPNLSEEAIDIHYDNSSGRARMIGTAHWALKTISINPVVLAQGDAQTMDGYTVTYEQYFAQSLNDETAQARVAKNLADEVTQQVATWFRNNDTYQTSVKTPNTPKPTYMLPSMNPGTNGAATQGVGVDGLPAMATGRNTMIPVGMDNMTPDDVPGN
ncbi:LPS assembly lipoprotein LptE [Commensalibacter communis]|uniref:LPS assembly lipoprotein LptE n=1 Tax=Commensalibacter communis TaxID=2972786 RepID=UPI0022FF4EEB|nr:LPS assembly lipoprotein LptE [Commensalibacter communis]CAI3950892.1 Predicted lipoprotein involved in lipopolysaccharide assembly [Commensalibacter communis]CAI3955619.1 Predicted lipoprotein involved in lipopolysaccharide assembly [Commensalibacter communis]